MDKPNWHHDIVQGTPEWDAIRLGKVTGSMMSDILATGKGGAPSLTRAKALNSILLARLTGLKEETYFNADMQRGKDLEPLARAAYEAFVEDFVDQVGFIDHPTIPLYGVSPDGYRGAIGLEIKCPRPSTHLETLRGAPIKKDYLDQIMAQMDCGEFEAVDFVSYCPEFPGKTALYIKRVMRDEQHIRLIHVKVEEFNEEVAAALEYLRARV